MDEGMKGQNMRSKTVLYNPQDSRKLNLIRSWAPALASLPEVLDPERQHASVHAALWQDGTRSCDGPRSKVGILPLQPRAQHQTNTRLFRKACQAPYKGDHPAEWRCSSAACALETESCLL